MPLLSTRIRPKGDLATLTTVRFDFASPPNASPAPIEVRTAPAATKVNSLIQCFIETS
jgi:hypothetical protein